MRRAIVIALILAAAFVVIYVFGAYPIKQKFLSPQDQPATSTTATSTPTQISFTAVESEENTTISRENARINAVYPVSSNENISRQLESFVKETVSEFNEQRPEEAPTMPGDVPIEMDVTYSVHESDKTVSYVFEIYSYTGGAHGATAVVSLVFDKESGRRIVLRNIIPDDRFPAVRQMLRTKLSEQLKENTSQEAIEFGTKTPEDLTAFYLTNNVLGFSFSSYAVGAYALGLVTVELPLSALNDTVEIDQIK